MEHIATPVVIEIDIDIREGDTVGIQETLKKEVVFNRVDFGDFEAIGYRRTCRGATTGTHRHAHVARCLDEVLHNEEVARETHVFDGCKLEIEAFAVFLVDFAPYFLRAFIHKVAQIVVIVLELRWKREVRENRFVVY